MITPVLSDAVVPITVAILTLLFAIQRHGTDKVGRVFGPVLIAWFCVIAGLGVRQIALQPDVLGRLQPHARPVVPVCWGPRIGRY